MEEDCCRICLSKTQSLDRQDLFMEEHNNLSVLGQLYVEVLNIPIANGNITLRYICNSCGLQLKLFKQLKNKALETYLVLVELLNTIPDKGDNRVENEIEQIKPFEINALLTETDKLSSTELRDEYIFEKDESTSTAEYIDFQDNEQEVDIIQNEMIKNETTVNDPTNDIIPQNGITQNDTNGSNTTEIDATEIDVIENKIGANAITEIDIIDNYLDEKVITKNPHEIRDDNILVQIEEEDEQFGCVELLIKHEENISLDTSYEEEYEVCYLDDHAILEKSEKEIEQKEYNEDFLIDEDEINEFNTIVKSTDDFHCPDCGETFELKSQLKSHRKKMHSIIRKIQCPLCNKSLLSEDTYQAHINVHNGLPAYQCNICEKAFNQKVHYNYHMLNHNNERNIICAVCQKGFLSSGDLKTHMRCHTDERRYKCDICDKRFRAHTHMVNHRYSHFEKQFECPSCFQKYMSPNTLRTHFKDVHSAEVPFECTYCEKRFKRKHHLQAHYKTHAKVMGNK